MEGLPVVEAGAGFTFLSGIKVLDLTTSVAGPYASMLLSDFGAEIIKVERPGGDDARGWGPPFLDGESLWFTAVNRNKKSIVLDLEDATDRANLRGLAVQADVVITNQPPKAQRKLGLDYEAFATLRPDIIFTSITGFGLTGERSDLTCYDLIAEGYSGVMDITGEADGGPQKIGAPAADMLAGQDAAMATIAALFDRMRTGKGHLVDVSLVESMTRFLSCRVSPYLGAGEVPARSGGTDSVIAIYQQFATSDLSLTLGLGNDGIWHRFWKAVGDQAYGERPEFRSNTLRRASRNEIVAKIQSILLTSPRDHWLTLFAGARVPAGPINTVEDVASDRALRERGLFFALRDGDRIVPQIGLGIRIDGRTAIPRSAPPRLGEHSHEYATAGATGPSV
ncbi:MAG: CaiB/BaiF CoA transferase family protein [Niveispirillum sp.]